MEVIVVGAGITGVAAAEWLRRDGHRVTLIDRVRPGDPAQTSYGNAGILACAGVVPVSVPGLIRKVPAMLLDPDSPLYLRWAYLPRLMPWLARFLWNGRRARVEEIARVLASLTGDSVEQHLALARGTPAERYVQRGYYTMIYPDRKAFERDAFGFALRRSNGFDWEEWDRARLSDYDPELSSRYTFCAALTDHGFVTQPGAYVAALAEHFERAGGHFLQGAVTGIAQEAGGRAAVTLMGGARREADRVVLAAGVWSAPLARALGHNPMMESERGYHLVLKHPSHRPPGPHMIADARTAVSPMEEGLRFAGTVDFGGIDGPPLRAPVAGIRKRVAQVYPNLRWQGETTWMGHRPSTVDSLPLVGPAPKAPAVCFAFGGQHLGLTMGPRLGRICADLIAGRKPNVDIAPLRPDRFDRR
ncbi:MAG TPA: FAD-binding oxidoreductase [Thermohalobaculum sp.]|nr:FAD-binding oxidoreductase [Thermohalobaculum sp.]